MDDRERAGAAESLLRRASLRVTEARVALMSALMRLKRPVAAADLIGELSDYGMSEVTIYRNLNKLADAGVLKRIDTPERRRRFELQTEGDHHHPHFVCDDCGDVRCLDEATLPEVPAFTLPEGFRATQHRVTVHGVCPSCDQGSSGTGTVPAPRG